MEVKDLSEPKIKNMMRNRDLVTQHTLSFLIRLSKLAIDFLNFRRDEDT